MGSGSAQAPEADDTFSMRADAKGDGYWQCGFPRKRDNVLPRRHRLTPDEFQLVKSNGQMRSGVFFGVLFLRRQAGIPGDKQQAKAGLIVSKKISTKATDRNLLKRHLRAALAPLLPELPTSLMLVVLPNKRALSVSVAELTTSLRDICVRSRYLTT